MVKLLRDQTADAYKWSNKMVESIPRDKWSQTPDKLDTNVSWQIGHLMMSYYYHSIVVITGHQMDILKKIPMQLYSELFTKGDPKKNLNKINHNDLIHHFNLIQKRSIDTIESLSDDDLYQNLVQTEVQHPIAKNKYEALDWNIKHTMWHCGQLGILKRIIDTRYDFGLNN